MTSPDHPDPSDQGIESPALQRDRAHGRIMMSLGVLAAAISAGMIAWVGHGTGTALGLALGWVCLCAGYMMRAGAQSREPKLQLVLGLSRRLGLRHEAEHALRARGVIDRLPVSLSIEPRPARSRALWSSIQLHIAPPPGAVFIDAIRPEHLTDAPPPGRPTPAAREAPDVRITEDGIHVGLDIDLLPDVDTLGRWVTAWVGEARLRCAPRADLHARFEAAARRGSVVAFRWLLDDPASDDRLADIVHHLSTGPHGEIRLLYAQRRGGEALRALADDEDEAPLWRGRAIEALIQGTGVGRWVEDLHRWVDRPPLRAPALRGLRLVGGRRSEAAILRIAEQDGLDDTARIELARALRQMPDAAAEPALLRLLEHPEPAVRTAVISGLLLRGSRPGTIEALMRLDGTPGAQWARQAIQAIRERVDPALGGGLSVPVASDGGLALAPDAGPDRLDAARDAARPAGGARTSVRAGQASEADG